MGERIGFRPRARGCAKQGPVGGVTYLEPRVAFIKGTTGTPSGGEVECGDGKAFCLQVTQSQLLKLMYRVKDAKLSGEILTDFSFATFAIGFSSGTMPTAFYSSSGSDLDLGRSYADTESPPANMTSEAQMWGEDIQDPQSYYGFTTSLREVGHSLVNAFTHYMESFAFPLSDYYPYGLDQGPTEWPAKMELAFSGRVAVIDNAGNMNPWDTANDLWVELEFHCFSWDSNLLDIEIYSLSDTSTYPDEAALSGMYLTFDFGGGDTASCQLYGSRAAVYSYTENAPFKMTVTEWWPYKNNAGNAAWNTTTGAPANEGPLG